MSHTIEHAGMSAEPDLGMRITAAKRKASAMSAQTQQLQQQITNLQSAKAEAVKTYVAAEKEVALLETKRNNEQLATKVDAKPGDLFMVMYGARMNGEHKGKFDAMRDCPIIGVFASFENAHACFCKYSKYRARNVQQVANYKTDLDEHSFCRVLMCAADFDYSYGGDDCVSLVQLRTSPAVEKSEE